MLYKSTPSVSTPNVAAALDAGVLPELNRKATHKVEAETWMSTRLNALSPSKPPHEIFRGLRPMVLQKLDLLRHVSAEQRSEFMEDLKNQALSHRTARVYLAAAFGRASFFCSHAEKVALLEALHIDRRRAGASILVAQILTNARSRTNTIQLIRALGEDKLFERRSPVLKEVHAICFIGHALMKVAFPPLCGEHLSHPKLLNRRLQELRSALESCLQIVASDPRHAGLSTSREYRNALQANLRDLATSFKLAKRSAEKREIINRTILRAKLEGRYVLKLTNTPDNGEQKARTWSHAELRHVQVALSRVPEPAILFTPKLHELVRVDQCRGDDVDMVASFTEGTGEITITDAVFTRTSKAELSRMLCALGEYLTHEMGHAFSDSLLVPGRTSRRNPAAPDFLLNIADSEFLNLGGWQIVRSGFKICDSGQGVKIGGQTFPLKQAVMLDGYVRVFRYSATYKTLFSHRGIGEFVQGTYCQTDPFEDWAESFSDYTMRPRRLIDHAPRKFIYFESLFRKYDLNAPLEHYLQARLQIARLKTAEPPSRNLHQDEFAIRAFNKLSLAERSIIVTQLESKRGEAEPRDSSNNLVTLDPHKLTRTFTSALIRQPARSRDTLRKAFSTYRPAALRALRIAEEQQAIAIFADRKDNSGEGLAKTPLIDALSGFLQNAFRRERLYMLDDPLKSKRLNKLTSAGKTAALLAEFAMGNSIRTGGLVKPLEPCRRIVYYDSSPMRLSQVAEALKAAGLLSKATFIDVGTLSGDHELAALFSAVPRKVKDEMHVFALDDGLVSLDAIYRVIHRETGKVLLKIPCREYHLEPDPDYWLGLVRARNPLLPLRSLLWDDYDFCDPATVRALIKDGQECNRMFRR